MRTTSHNLYYSFLCGTRTWTWLNDLNSSPLFIFNPTIRWRSKFFSWSNLCSNIISYRTIYWLAYTRSLIVRKISFLNLLKLKLDTYKAQFNIYTINGSIIRIYKLKYCTVNINYNINEIVRLKFRKLSWQKWLNLLRYKKKN